MGRLNVNLLPSCLEMPAVAFTVSRLGDLQAPPGHGDDISAGELATSIADGRLPFANALQRLDRSGKGEINEAGGRADTPWLRGGGAGRLLSGEHLEGFVWLLPSEDLTLPLDVGVLLIWLACSDRGQGIAGFRSQSAAGCQETSFLVASGCRGCCLPSLAGATCNILDGLHKDFVLLANTASTRREGQIIGVLTVAGVAEQHFVVCVASVCPVYGAHHPPPPEGLTSLLGSDPVRLLDLYYTLKTHLKYECHFQKKKNTFVLPNTCPLYVLEG